MIASLASVLRPAARSILWLDRGHRLHPLSERVREKDTAFDRIVLGCIDAFRRATTEPLLVARAPICRAVAKLADELRALDDDALRESAAQLSREAVAEGLSARLRARSFALVREATRRERGIAHHPVQLLAADAMLDGRIVEMATGEGKTITTMLAAAGAALAGIPVHVMTVNDYLAHRDAEELAPIYARLGLSVGFTRHDLSMAERRAAYACDIVYATSQTIVFDYLRDRLALGGRRSPARLRLATTSGLVEQPVQRGLHFALVDEIDSVLIDEAQTPLIISGGTPGEVDASNEEAALRLARGLEQGRHFLLEPQLRRVTLTPAGEARLAEQVRDFSGYWRAKRAREELAVQALSALHLYRRDHDYIVLDGKVQIVDASTGRVLPDRQWQQGLHQLIEIKEGCEVSGRRVVTAQITYQEFFRRYLRLAGATGTGAEVAREIRSVYGVPMLRVPTHRPPRRIHRGVHLAPSQAEKWRAVARSVAELSAHGRPVLVGTKSVAASERLSAELDAAGIAHRVLNARQDAEEAAIVAEAGGRGRVTVATNMAGRGTDIKLERAVEALGGLHVILTEFHESSRVDRQLYGRAARQGDRGSCEAIVSLDDDLLREQVSGLARFAGRFDLWRVKGSSSFVATMLRLLAQANCGRRAARSRRATLLAAAKLDHALAFGKRAE